MEEHEEANCDLLKQKLQESEARFRLLYESLPIGLFTTDAEGNCLVVNTMFRDIMCASLEDALKKKWYEWIHPKLREKLKASVQEAIKSRRRFITDVQILRADGKVRWIRLSFRSMISDIGVSYTGTVDDITEQKQAEKKRLTLERELHQAHKLESIGTLAAGIAHEMNTPIQFIGDNVRFLSDTIRDMDSLLEVYQECIVKNKALIKNDSSLKKIEEKSMEVDMKYLREEIPVATQQTFDGINRVSKIVNAMKDFSHIGQDQKKPTDINKGIESTVTVCRNEWKYASEVVLELASDMPLVHCLSADLNQVVMNLIVNAAHAIAERNKKEGRSKGEIVVRTTHSDTMARIVVKDNGSGIPADIQRKVFEPFFTTKAVGKGTGQGLSMAYQTIVERHDGKFWLESTVDVGTTFYIELPIREE